MNYVVYANINVPFNQLGFDWGSVIGPAIGQGIGLIGGLIHGSGGGASTKITGTAIAPAAQQIIQQLQQLLAAMQAGQIPENQKSPAIEAGNQIARSLFDSNVFDTDRGHSTLVPFQQQAVSLMQQVQAASSVPFAGTATPGTTVTTQPTIDPVTGATIPAGTVIPASAEMTILGFPATTLLLLAGGGLLLWVVLSK